MTEQNNMNHLNDDIQQRIVERLGERERKLGKIVAWERASRKGHISLYTAVSVAASLLLVVLLNPFASGGGNVYEELGIMQPGFSSYRSSMDGVAEVERLIDDGECYEALDIIENLLKESERNIKNAEKTPMFDDEEWVYEYKSEKLFYSELRWTYIYLLIVLECENSAVKELKRYIADDEFCIHKAEAEKLLRALD